MRLSFILSGFAVQICTAINVIPTTPAMNFFAKNSDGKRLFNDMFLTYLKAERPVKNESTAVRVVLDPVFINILSIDEVDEAVTINLWMRVRWYDEWLAWDPDKYGGRKQIHIPFTMIWKPDIIVYNNLRMIDHVDENQLFAIVNSSGFVQYGYPAIFEVSCDLNIKYFPFDEQNCSLKFASWTNHGFAIDLHKLRDEPPLYNYKPNPEWDLKNARVDRHVVMYPCCPEPYPDVTVSFLIKRKPLFYIITLIFPASLITIVSIVGLFSPSQSSGEREERMTVGLMTLLAMSLLLMMVADLLPRTSKVVPILGMFYGYQIFLCAAATMNTVAIMNLEKEGHYNREPPHWARNFFIEVLPVYLGMDWRKKEIRRKITNVHWIHQGKSLLSGDTLNKILEEEPATGTMMTYIEAEIVRMLKEMHDRHLKIDHRHVVKNDWDRICDCIDRICMIVYLCLFGIGSWVIFFAL